MALDDDEKRTIALLDRQIGLAKKDISKLDMYLEGEQPLRYMAPALEAEIGATVTQLVINWPMLVVDAHETRLDIRGFRYAKQSDRDPVLWDWWDRVDGEEKSQIAHFEALGLKRCYAMVGSAEDDSDPPVLTIEHPSQVAVRRYPRTGEVIEGLKRWKEDDGSQHGVLCLPDETITLEKRGRGWVDVDRDEHDLGECTIVPIVHRPRLTRPDGRSIFQDVIPLADAANKMASDMMVSGDFHAMPRRVAFGFAAEDFIDENGDPLSTWEQIAGRVWATEKGPKDADVKQFPEADLANFHATIRLLAQLVAQLVGLPDDYMSFTSDNPSSADAIRANEARLVKRCERIQTPFGGGWERVGRLFLRFDSDGAELKPEAHSLKTVWTDPATPTRAQQADAVMKLVGAKILPVEQAREDLGYDEEQRRRMRNADDDAARRSLELLAGAGEPAVKPDPAPVPGAG